MTDPERFLDGEGPEREFLQSASSDAGSDAAYRRVQRTIGAGLAVTSASGAAAAGASGAMAAGKAKAVATLALGKWLLLGATAGTVVAGTAYLAFAPGGPAPPEAARTARSGNPHSSPRPLDSAARERAAKTAETAEGALPILEQAPALARLQPVPSSNIRHRAHPTGEESHEAAPVAEGARTPPAAVPSAPPATAPLAPPSLADEVHVVDAARAALGRNDSRAALAELARHRRDFPGGALQLEATVLGVRALLEAGQRPAAEREAARVLAAHPRGPYADRVRGLLGWSAKP